jgi:hypothetical protein
MDFDVMSCTAVLDHDAIIVHVVNITKCRIEITPDCFHCGHQILSGMASDWQQRKTLRI